MARTCIVKCNCKSEYQDERYGIGKRLANIKTKAPERCTCTTCGKEHGTTKPN